MPGDLSNYHHREKQASSLDHLHTAHLHQTEHRIERYLSHNGHDFRHVFHEIDHLRQQHPHQFRQDLAQLNHDLHKKGFLPHLTLIEDDRLGRHHRVLHGFDVVADDRRNPKGNHTIVSTTRHRPTESEELKNAYHSMPYEHGKYNGFDQSVEAAGGADGGYDKHAVGGKIPTGARKDLIDQALKLAGVPVTPQNEAAVNKIVIRESGWNPNITNNWDSNARAGHPSTGLMQTIPATFHKYALPGMNQNIHDPLSNLVAGIRYAEARYGGHGMSGVAKVASRAGGY